jgi:hypothetical protein
MLAFQPAPSRSVAQLTVSRLPVCTDPQWRLPAVSLGKPVLALKVETMFIGAATEWAQHVQTGFVPLMRELERARRARRLWKRAQAIL